MEFFSSLFEADTVARSKPLGGAGVGDPETQYFRYCMNTLVLAKIAGRSERLTYLKYLERHQEEKEEALRLLSDHMKCDRQPVPSFGLRMGFLSEAERRHRHGGRRKERPVYAFG